MGTEGERDLSRSAVTMRPNNALLANIDTIKRPFSLGGGRIAPGAPAPVGVQLWFPDAGQTPKFMG